MGQDRRRCACWVIASILGMAATGLGWAGVQAHQGIQLIPQPVSLVRGEGHFQLDGTTRIGYGPGARAKAEQLRDELARLTGFPLTVGPAPDSGSPAASIHMAIDRQQASLGQEGYRLEVGTAGIRLLGATETGLYYATRTLRQLLPIRRIGGLPPDLAEWTVPAVTIEDRPRFPWRGVMLDCSRTFQSTDYIRATLDRMAFYKMNVLHLHLTDDQGWRLEILRYPELTGVGARFPDHWQEPAANQGFYSQPEIRELVRYASDRHITIVPEIEIPGHALAALATYPHLSCTGGPFEIHPFFKGPNIHEDIFCAGNDQVVEFLEAVLEEVIELFPSEFIHIGGDEAPKARWKQCPKCQARIRDLGLGSEDELQSWLIERMGRFVRERGRRIIGWDEILEGGLPPGAAVMSWRGVQGGIAAAQAGQAVVMSPTSHCYFDYTYSQIGTQHAYGFEPVPEALTPEQSRLVLGLQANFWSHIDREPALVDRQLFPRLLSIAERGWSPREVRDWPDFQWRVKVHLAHLDELNVSYFREEPE